ncbi:MAG: hypothetical protein ACTS8S_01990 [Giesbergeria sp.]
MGWTKITLAYKDNIEAKAFRLQTQFNAIFIKVLTPAGAAMFQAHNMEHGRTFRFSPKAARSRRRQGPPMKIHVECYAGYRGEQEPRAFSLGERRLEVVSLLDRWLAPEHRYFKVAASDGNTYILRYDETREEWELGAFRQGVESPRPWPP